MGEVIDWDTSEPPSRYVLAFGTNHCLVEQDYDHDIYEECGYIGSRTLIKCKAVRKKSDLKENGGVCELHKRFHESIRNRFGCEERRLAQDSGQVKPKYTPVLNQDGVICDEFPWLMPSHRWESPLIRSVFDDAPDDDAIASLRNAGVYTDKDIVRIRKALLEKRIDSLKLHAEMVTERARRQANDLLSKNRKLTTLGGSQSAITAACSSIDDYGIISKRIKSTKKFASGEWVQKLTKLCSFGKQSRIDATDSDDLSSVVGAMVECVVNGKTGFSSYLEVTASKEITSPKTGASNEKLQSCSSLAVPLSTYCISHQMLDERQLLFVPCSICHLMCTDIHTPPLCCKHMKELSFGNRILPKDVKTLISPAVNIAPGVLSMPPAPKLKSFNDPSKPLFGLPPNSNSAPFLLGSLSERRVAKRLSVDVHTKEEVELLAKRFKAEVPAELTVAEALKQGHSPAVIEALRRAELRRNREDEACTCARIRPFERAQFPPKQSLPRRVANSVVRAPVQIRRPTVIDGAPLHQSSSLLVAHAGQTSARVPSASDYRQIVQIPQRRSQPPHRVFTKESRPTAQYSLISTTSHPSDANRSVISSSTSFASIGEAGHEVLVEDRRTPPPNNEKTPGTVFTRPPISSYRRQMYPGLRQPVTGHRGREIDGQRRHSAFPPPPDPPIIPLSRISERPAFASVRDTGNSAGVSNANHREVVTLGGRTGPIIIPTTSIRNIPASSSGSDAEVAPTNSEHALSQSSIRARFPSILRKVEAPMPTATIPPTPPPTSHPSPASTSVPVPRPMLAQTAGQQTSQPQPRPPPSSRPLPPHRLIPAPRPVPPHRLIKTLPLPTVPTPRNKVNSTSNSTSNTPEPPKEQDHTEEPVPLSSSEKQFGQEKMFVEKDMDPLSILAAVSEAARDDAAKSITTKSQTPAASESSKDGAHNEEEDEEYEEEL
ncbi:hypothetical protein RB195_010038 [Necator americanus]